MIENKNFRLAVIVNLSISIIFLILTSDNTWVSDDYPYIFGTKLFNLINNQTFFIYEFMGSEERFVPLFWFIVQFIPENYFVWHCVVILIFFLTSLIIFEITKKITDNNSISLLTSVLFSLHYSISIKSLSWAIFFGHIFNAFFGFLSVLIYFSIIKNDKKKNIFLLLYVASSFVGTLIMETGLIYPLITLLMVFLFNNKKIIKNFLPILLPIILYILVVFLSTGKFLPIFFERYESSLKSSFSNEIISDTQSDLYYNRSTYAPRNLTGYSLRVFDNILSTFNISSLENSLRFYDLDGNLKNFLKNNIIIFFIFFILLLTVFIFLTLKDFLRSKKDSNFLKILILHIFIFAIYSFIYFRRDLNIALSFSSALIIAYFIMHFFDSKKYIISCFIMFLFIFPSLIYASTKFEYFADFQSKQKLNNIFKQYKILTENNNLDTNLKSYENFKYFFYYKNYNKYKISLSKYKKLSLQNFEKMFEIRK